jgi:hypothetical protein
MKAIPTTYRGIQFRSRLEATWAAFFDAAGWQWEYEPFDMDGWIPDFALASALTAPEPVLVEVKPISAFAPEVAAKIDAADQEHEVLLVGIGPFSGTNLWHPRPVCLGWLREIQKYEEAGQPHVDFAWGNAVLGRWEGSESKEKNPDGILGFCHEEQSFRDRITGCYDGGCMGGQGGISSAEVETLWAESKNKVQWQPQGRDGPKATAARLNAGLDWLAAHNERLAADAGMASNPRFVAARDRRARISREIKRARAWWE